MIKKKNSIKISEYFWGFKLLLIAIYSLLNFSSSLAFVLVCLVFGSQHSHDTSPSPLCYSRNQDPVVRKVSVREDRTHILIVSVQNEDKG